MEEKRRLLSAPGATSFAINRAVTVSHRTKERLHRLSESIIVPRRQLSSEARKPACFL